MKKSLNFSFAFFIVVITVFSSCTSINHTMREPNVALKLTRADFDLSSQVSAKATTVKVFGIDWARLFSKKTGELGSSQLINAASIPVLGTFISERTSNYALYELMTQNPNYDVVIYPQYETKEKRPFLGIGFIIKITTVKATARLGRLKSDDFVESTNSNVIRTNETIKEEVPSKTPVSETVSQNNVQDDYTNSEISGKWKNKNGDIEITITGDVGVFSQINDGKWSSFLKKGKISIGSPLYKDITKTSPLTWQCKVLVKYLVSTDWQKCRLTLDESGKILKDISTNETFYRIDG